jgi:hypothetical protein
MAAVAGAATAASRASYAFGSHVLALDVDDPWAAQILQTTYGPLRLAAPRPAAHTAVVRRLAGDRLHVRFDRRTLMTGCAPTAVPLLSSYYVLREVFARFVSAQPSHIAFHGALSSIEGAGVLILGPASIGKTVLGIHLASCGARFLGDESAALDVRQGTARALARTPSLRESAFPYLPAALAARIAASPHSVQTERGRFWYALEAGHLNGIAGSDAPHRLAAVCVIRGRAEQSSVRRIDASAALPAIIQRAYTRPSQLLEISALKKALRHAAIFELDLGDPHDAAAALVEQVRACV